MDALAELADRLRDAERSGPLRMRVTTVTQIGGDGRLRTELTGDAWLTRNLDSTFSVDDVVIILVSRSLSIVVARIG